jgi:hypothetical protein
MVGIAFSHMTFILMSVRYREPGSSISFSWLVLSRTNHIFGLHVMKVKMVRFSDFWLSGSIDYFGVVTTRTRHVRFLLETSFEFWPERCLILFKVPRFPPPLLTLCRTPPVQGFLQACSPIDDGGSRIMVLVCYSLGCSEQGLV